MSPSADLNLLFGIIALQTNFITRAQLVAAFDAWVEDKSRDLAQILVATKALTTEGHDALTRLVALFLEKHGGDAERSLAAMSSISLVKPDLERLGDPDLGASLGHVAQDVSDFVSLPTTADVSPGLPGRFRILRPHAKGGLGQVSVALDQELHREVALKEILTQHSDDPTARERFVLEAEITGGLEHPGIVPVYALGQSADGRPFYAMRFVKGDSLKQAIEQFHRPDNPNRKDAGTWQLELRQLLGRFIDVCNAMEYAHSRGVLHRDLKPGNIMVGKYGETLVVDWGLAKAMGTREIGSDDAPLCPSSSLSSSVQTQPGSAIGTPAYMSPEQAAGKLDDLGPATDVYSLGATLYHLLCGRPPFEKEHLGELLRKVQKGEFARPRMVAPEIPRSLEAICLKAMQSSPADRYPTARALADDIEHWLADEPISASTDTASERISRWGRKHRTVVQAGGISLVVIAGVAIVAAFWINQERDEKARLADEKTVLADEKTAAQALEREARIEAENHLKETQRTLAQVHFERGLLKERDGQNSESLVDFFLAATTASEDSLIKNAYQRVLLDRLTCQYALVSPPLFHDDAVLSVAFSLDGTRVVTGSSDNTARLWDAQTGVAVGDVMKHDVTVSSVAFSPDGTRVVTGSWDKTARLWDARTGAAVGAVMKHHDIVSNVAFSPDGTRVLTESEDKTARLWDAQTGVAVGDVMKHDRHVNSVAFSPDGTRVATGSSDNTARLWDVSIPPPGDDSRARLDLLFELMTGCRITSERTGQTVRIPAQELFAIRRRLGDDDPLLKFQRERFARLATSHIPAAETPIYLTKKRQQRNVLRNSSFDDVISDENWVVTTYLQNEQVASRQEQVRHGGTHSVQFETAEADDARLLQNVVVKPNTEYLLSGWIKTQDVFITQDGGRSGASLAIEETHQSTASVIATKDWTYVTLQFNSGDRTELHLGPRLGHFGSTCTGTAWFDDLCLIEMFPQEADESE